MKIKKITPKKIINVLKKEWYVLALIVFVIVTRYIFLHDATIPFGFDHGKDSLAVFHMWTTRSLKFIGPWTSIPGLYFGPAWYYLLLPGLLLFN